MSVPAKPPPLPPLPISPLLPSVCDAVGRGPVVVSAATGSGKSTCVPPALTIFGRVLVVEPRRVACRALASRVAELMGCNAGGEVGWIVRDERRADDDARVTFVTPGVALRLVETGDIDAYGAVVIDEFHERGFDTDLLLALLQDRRSVDPSHARQALVVMSATMQGDRVAAHLGGVHLVGEGRTYPIELRWMPGDTSLPSKRGLEERILDALHAVAGDPGDVLVFLPGKAEIARVDALLRARGAGAWELFSLHGDMSLRDQADVLAERPDRSRSRRRRVILATNVAETSLTIPGIGVVIDSGLVRGMVYRAGRGYLSLLPVARDAADQRAGRAGRLGPGVCVRLWSPKAALEDVTLPEIHRGSLVSLALSALACNKKGMDLPWLDRPRSYAVSAALAELEALGCVKGGVITDAGRHLFSLPLDVELGRLLTQAARVDGLAEPALLLAAALSAGRSLFRRADPTSANPYGAPRGGVGAPSGGDLRAAGCDAVALIEAVRAGDVERDGLDPKALAEARAAAARFRKLGFGDPSFSGPLPRRALAELLMRVWPGSAHVRRDQKRGRFTWAAGGPELELGPESTIRQQDHEALIVLDSRAVAADGRSRGLIITAAMPVPVAWLAAAGLGEDVAGAPSLDGKRVRVTISRMYAGRELSTREESPTGATARAAIRDLILEGRLFKGARRDLEARHERAALAVQVALVETRADASLAPLPPLRDWLLARLEALGLESPADLALLVPEDLMPPEPPPDIALTIDRNYPKSLDIGDARYRIAYDLPQRVATLHQTSGARKDPPTAMHLPRLPGLRVYWEHKNRVQPVPGRG
jgi:ATP-dependent helicase HrpB